MRLGMTGLPPRRRARQRAPLRREGRFSMPREKGELYGRATTSEAARAGKVGPDPPAAEGECPLFCLCPDLRLPGHDLQRPHPPDHQGHCGLGAGGGRGPDPWLSPGTGGPGVAEVRPHPGAVDRGGGGAAGGGPAGGVHLRPAGESGQGLGGVCETAAGRAVPPHPAPAPSPGTPPTPPGISFSGVLPMWR